MVKLSRKQERLFHELSEAQTYYDKPRITREYILEKYPTDKDANKRLNEGIHTFGGFEENYEEKEKQRIEHNFPGLTQYGCTDPLHDYKSHFKNCAICPRRKECEEDVEWIKKELDRFGSTYRKKKTKSIPKRKIIKKPIKKTKKIVKKIKKIIFNTNNK